MAATSDPPIRVGHGYDLHRLEPIAPRGSGRPFVLAGVRFEHPLGPVGHSDGDAVHHAVTDAIIGSLGQADIGELFPDTDPDHEGADSTRFVEAAVTQDGILRSLSGEGVAAEAEAVEELGHGWLLSLGFARRASARVRMACK